MMSASNGLRFRMPFLLFEVSGRPTYIKASGNNSPPAPEILGFSPEYTSIEQCVILPETPAQLSIFFGVSPIRDSVQNPVSSPDLLNGPQCTIRRYVKHGLYCVPDRPEEKQTYMAFSLRLAMCSNFLSNTCGGI